MNEDKEYITVKEFQARFPGILRGLKHTIVITRYGDDLCVLTPTTAAGELEPSTADSGRGRRGYRKERGSPRVGVHEDGEVGQELADQQPATDDTGVQEEANSL